MLDIKWIREHEEQLQEVADRKRLPVSIRELLETDTRKRALQQEVEEGRRTRNAESERIGELMRKGDQAQAEEAREAVKALNRRLEQLEEPLREEAERLEQLMLLVPNPVSPDTPAGASDADNVEVRRMGAPPVWSFEPLDHIRLGELHRMIDIPRGVKTGGVRSYFLTGAGALLHRAVQQLAMDLLTADGFLPMEVPLMVRPETLAHTGFFPTGREQVYRIEDENRYLVGTSEAPLVAYYAGEIVDLNEPVKAAAASTCFRSEVGSAGRDVHGLYRVHQFSKVEQVVLCRADPELSERLLQHITANAERLLQLLELPYRVMAVCIGDMSQKTYKQYDIETWMPSRGTYGETHSSSNLHDFQARRANIRYRDSDGRLRYAHTLNNTMVATPRILIPLLENHQQEDGSIRIPVALRPYMGGIERLMPPGMV
ncbi:serine--tRNA ligase [Gorillibacterium sp. sgz5001074]|uniref:serine--tRNA ligase n=1 Tax=Gorillibacterium sp. sgz5001074 TaxID=3446695 RepID=UPI003F66944B